MARLDYTGAFAKYGAKLNNYRTDMSAFAKDGTLVVSLYSDWLKREGDQIVYRDKLSDWVGGANGAGAFRRHLTEAHAAGSRLRLVVATPTTKEGAALVGKVSDESTIDKTFSVRKNLIGTIAEWDGDAMVLVFRRH